MRLNSRMAVTLGVVLVAGTAALGARAGQQQGPPPVPKPGPEHELLKMDEGTWDAVVEITSPGAPPMTSKGVEVNTMGCGGLCLITDFKAEMMPGVQFHGHGIGTWDASRKAYVGSWTDSMSKGMLRGESKWEPESKRMTGWMEGPDMTGAITKTRSVVEYKGATRVFTTYAAGPDGKETQVMRITYSKKK